MYRGLFVFLTLGVFTFLGAKPEGFIPISGEVAAPVRTDPESWIIRSTGRSVVQWDSFSLSAREKIRFDQLGKDAAILNRVTGAYKSEIYGQILSNAPVYLINPQGVFIGPNAQIETAGFVASCLDLTDSAFIEGKNLLFSGGGRGDIVNLGTIRCASGSIALIGHKITNQGTLEAAAGQVALAVGSEVLLQPQSNPFVLIRAPILVETEEETQPGAAISQEGLIRAVSTELKCGSSVYAKAIQNTGIIEGTSVQSKGGKVFLCAEGGKIEHRGKISANQPEGSGGSIHILAEQIHLKENSTLEASGSTQGGQIVIGDNRSQQMADGSNAKQVVLDASASIKANASQKGSGGEVFVWGDEGVIAKGSIEAQGGASGGNGGFVEISSPRFLVPQALVNTSAPQGQTGIFLIDPSTVTISNAVDSGQTVMGGVYDFNSSIANVNIPNLIQNLSLNNIVIDATTGSGAGDGSVTITHPIQGNGGGTGSTSWTNNSLTIRGTSITVDAGANISWNGTGTLSLASTTGGVTVLGTIANTSAAPSSYTALQIAANNTNGSASTGLSIFAPLTSNYGDIQLSGTGGTDAGGLQYGVDVGALVQGKNITFTNCFGGASTGINNFGLLIESGTTVSAPTGTIEFDTIAGGSGTGMLNHGAVIFGTVSGQTITGSSIQSGPSTDLAYGLYISGGVFGDSTLTTSINVSAMSMGTGTDAQGILVDSFGTIGLADNAIATLTGSSLGGGSGTSCNGIYLMNNSSLILGDAASLTLTGSVIAGADFGANMGVRFAPSLITFNGTNQEIEFLNCTGGTAGPNNYGASFEAYPVFPSGSSLSFIQCTGGASVTDGGIGTDSNHGVGVIGTIESSSMAVLFQNCTGGASSLGNQNHGVYCAGNMALDAGSVIWTQIAGGGAGSSSTNCGIYFAPGVSIQAPTLQSTSVLGGQTSGSNNVGVYVHGATLGSDTLPTTITLTGTGRGSGSAETGILIDNGGLIQTASTGVITLTGVGSSLGTASPGLTITGTDSAIHTVNGNLLLTGTGYGTTPYGVLLESSAAPNLLTSGTGTIRVSSSSSSICLNSTSSPLVSGQGNITFNGPVLLNSIAASPIIGSASTVLDFVSTVDGAQSLTIGGIDQVIFEGVVGGITPLASLTVNSLVNQNGGALANGKDLTVTATGDITFTDTIRSIGAPFGGDVLITSTGGSISVADITTAGNNGGSITLQPASGYTSTSLGNLPVGTLILNGTLDARGTAGSSNDIFLSPEGRAVPLSVATITSSLSGNDVTLYGRNFSVGTYEAVTILGALTATMSGSITIGDTIALTDLNLTAGTTTTLVGHGSVALLNSQGALYISSGGHIYSFTPPQVDITNTVGEIGYIGPVVGLSAGQFEAALVYNGVTILNFDQSSPTPTPSNVLTRNAFFQLALAQTEMEDLFPLIYLPVRFPCYYPEGRIVYHDDCPKP